MRCTCTFASQVAICGPKWICQWACLPCRPASNRSRPEAVRRHTRLLLARLGNTNVRERQIWVAQRGHQRRRSSLLVPAPRTQGLQHRGTENFLVSSDIGHHHRRCFMRKRRDSGTKGAGVRSGRASDLRDTRQGTYGPAGNQTQEDLSDPTSRELAQSGGATQGDPVPAQNFQLPEGIRNKPTANGTL